MPIIRRCFKQVPGLYVDHVFYFIFLNCVPGILYVVGRLAGFQVSYFTLPRSNQHSTRLVHCYSSLLLYQDSRTLSKSSRKVCDRIRAAPACFSRVGVVLL